jgi:hypothetical protein
MSSRMSTVACSTPTSESWAATVRLSRTVDTIAITRNGCRRRPWPSDRATIVRRTSMTITTNSTPLSA